MSLKQNDIWEENKQEMKEEKTNLGKILDSLDRGRIKDPKIYQSFCDDRLGLGCDEERCYCNDEVEDVIINPTQI